MDGCWQGVLEPLPLRVNTTFSRHDPLTRSNLESSALPNTSHCIHLGPTCSQYIYCSSPDSKKTLPCTHESNMTMIRPRCLDLPSQEDNARWRADLCLCHAITLPFRPPRRTTRDVDNLNASSNKMRRGHMPRAHFTTTSTYQRTVQHGIPASEYSRSRTPHS